MKPFALLYPLPLKKGRSDEKLQLPEVSPSSSAPVNVKALRYGKRCPFRCKSGHSELLLEHVGEAVESTLAAFDGDPLQAYINAVCFDVLSVVY